MTGPSVPAGTFPPGVDVRRVGPGYEESYAAARLCLQGQDRPQLNEGLRRKAVYLERAAGRGLEVYVAYADWADGRGPREAALLEAGPLETVEHMPVEGRDCLFIHCLWVYEEFQGRGIGAALVRLAEARARGVGLGWTVGVAVRHTWYVRPAWYERVGLAEIERKGRFRLVGRSLSSGGGARAPAAFMDGAWNPRAFGVRRDEPVVLYYNDQCPYWSRQADLLGEWSRRTGCAVGVVRLEGREAVRSTPTSGGIYVNGRLRSLTPLGSRELASTLALVPRQGDRG